MKKKKKREKSRDELSSSGGGNGSGMGAARKIGVLFLNFVLFYVLLRLIIMLAERTGLIWVYYAGTLLYMLFGAGCFVAFFVLNGYSFERREKVLDELPEEWSDAKKMEFLARQSENKARARRLIYVILPIVVTLIISYIELTFIR